MKKMFFLTAIFQNKFGKANKYYDDKGWHWMLASDKPKLFSTQEEAKKEAEELSKDILSEISIKEIEVYSMLWEHKFTANPPFTLTDVIYTLSENQASIYLSTKKQTNDAKLVLGLYRIDRKEDRWIFGTEEKQNPEEYIFQSYQKLQEAKALMQIFDYEKSQISKIDGVMLFVQRLLKGNLSFPNNDDTISTTPDELITISYEKLKQAKQAMIDSRFEQSDITKLEGVMIFVQKLL